MGINQMISPKLSEVRQKNDRITFSVWRRVVCTYRWYFILWILLGLVGGFLIRNPLATQNEILPLKNVKIYGKYIFPLSISNKGDEKLNVSPLYWNRFPALTFTWVSSYMKGDDFTAKVIKNANIDVTYKVESRKESSLIVRKEVPFRIFFPPSLQEKDVILRAQLINPSTVRISNVRVDAKEHKSFTGPINVKIGYSYPSPWGSIVILPNPYATSGATSLDKQIFIVQKQTLSSLVEPIDHALRIESFSGNINVYFDHIPILPALVAEFIDFIPQTIRTSWTNELKREIAYNQQSLTEESKTYSDLSSSSGLNTALTDNLSKVVLSITAAQKMLQDSLQYIEPIGSYRNIYPHGFAQLKPSIITFILSKVLLLSPLTGAVIAFVLGYIFLMIYLIIFRRIILSTQDMPKEFDSCQILLLESLSKQSLVDKELAKRSIQTLLSNTTNLLCYSPGVTELIESLLPEKEMVIDFISESRMQQSISEATFETSLKGEYVFLQFIVAGKTTEKQAINGLKVAKLACASHIYLIYCR